MYEWLLIAITAVGHSGGEHVAFQKFQSNKECQAAATFIDSKARSSSMLCMQVKKDSQ